MRKTNSHGETVKATIIETGLALWRMDASLATARRIGKEIRLSHGAVLYHFGSSENMRDAIAREAVRRRDAVIVPQLIVARHYAVADLSEADKIGFMQGY